MLKIDDIDVMAFEGRSEKEISEMLEGASGRL